MLRPDRPPCHHCRDGASPRAAAPKEHRRVPSEGWPASGCCLCRGHSPNSTKPSRCWLHQRPGGERGVAWCQSGETLKGVFSVVMAEGKEFLWQLELVLGFLLHWGRAPCCPVPLAFLASQHRGPQGLSAQRLFLAATPKLCSAVVSSGRPQRDGVAMLSFCVPVVPVSSSGLWLLFQPEKQGRYDLLLSRIETGQLHASVCAPFSSRPHSESLTTS